DVNGTAKLANTADGINDKDAVSILENVISGNGANGINLSAVPASASIIQGNFIGTDIHGTATLGNTTNGIDVAASHVTIGGTASTAANVISGNTQAGILIEAATSGAVILGNKIGTNVAGSSALANQGSGVQIKGTGNTVGGSATGAGNLI